MKRRALISLSDKTGVVEFARKLIELGFEIISTGGTSKLLKNHQIDVTEVNEVTNFPECLGGRVKTLHPLIHGAILGRRTDASHVEQMNELSMQPIDIVAVNLYPFKSTVLKQGSTFDDAIENIDIGGPSMIRSSAKNHESVYVLTDSKDYAKVLEAVSAEQGKPSENYEEEHSRLLLRRELATKAFEHTAYYDAMIATYFRGQCNQGEEPPFKTFCFELRSPLRYGENSHQAASYYVEPFSDEGMYEVMHGKEMSFNNYNDLSAAINGVMLLQEPACFAVKHASPCGAAIGSTPLDAYTSAYASDPLSIFGGIVAFNTIVDAATAEKLSEIFLEVIAAPEFTAEAFGILQRKKNIRIIRFEKHAKYEHAYPVFEKVRGGVLVQSYDEMEDGSSYQYVTERKPTEKELQDLQFAMKVCKMAKSNAIVIAKDQCTVGIGQGQVSRVFASKAAVENAVLETDGAVLASDAFFPFVDALEVAVKAGITAVIQPGGSVGDEDVIRYCNEHNIAMIFTGRRHFRHAY